MTKKIKIKKIDGDIVIHTLTRVIKDIEKEELEEYGKCMFCSIEHYCNKLKPTCNKTKIYEEVER